jgi:hypothetical protein
VSRERSGWFLGRRETLLWLVVFPVLLWGSEASLWEVLKRRCFGLNGGSALLMGGGSGLYCGLVDAGPEGWALGCCGRRRCVWERLPPVYRWPGRHTLMEREKPCFEPMAAISSLRKLQWLLNGLVSVLRSDANTLHFPHFLAPNSHRHRNTVFTKKKLTRNFWRCCADY